MKKIISYFLAVLMFLQGTTFVHAAEIAGNSADNSLRLVQVSSVGEDLAETELQNLVSANVYEPGSLTIVTTGFTAYNADTDVVFKLLPVLVNGKYVGIVHIGRENACSFSTNIDLLEEIECLKSDTYLLYVYDGNYYAESENECVPLVSTGFSVDGNSGFDLLTFEQKKEILL